MRIHSLRILRNVPGSLLVGSIVVGIFLLLAAIGHWLAPYDIEQFNMSARLSLPSPEHWLGTDRYGRDMLSRLMAGARETMVIALGSVALSLVLGLVIGLISGYRGGLVDGALMRTMDIVMAFPSLLLALLVVAVLGGGTLNTILSVGIVFTPKIARVVRSAVLSLRGAAFIEAAILRGESDTHVLFREIFPNIFPPLIVETCIRLSYAVLVSVSLSYLGLGAQPPTPEWGLMIGKEKSLLLSAPWVVLVPAIAITLLILGINMLGDGLREVLVAKKSHD